MKRLLLIISCATIVALMSCDKTLTENYTPSFNPELLGEDAVPLTFSNIEYAEGNGFTVMRGAEEAKKVTLQETAEPLYVSYEEGCEEDDESMCLEMTAVERPDLTAEEVAEKYGTRAAPVTDFASKYSVRGIGLYAYVFPANESWNASKHTSEYIHNLGMRPNPTTGLWTPNWEETTTENGESITRYHWYFWPGPQYKIRFYAYAPYRGDDHYKGIGIYTNMDLKTSAITGAPEITYGIPATIKNHFDFCIAKTDDITGDYNKAHHLKFRHMMTAVQIVIGKNMPKDVITKIQMVEMWRTGTIDLETQTWSIARDFRENDPNNDNATHFIIEKEIPITGQGQIVNSGDDMFMLLPTTTYEGARVEITFKKAGVKIFDIGNQNWTPGSMVTYTLNKK